VLRCWRGRAALRDAARRAAALAEVAVVAVAVAALLVVSVNKPRDWVHMAVLYWPFLMLLVVYGRAAGRRSRVLGVALAAAALLVMLPFGRYTVRLARELAVQHPTPLAAARGGIRVKPAEARVLDDAVAWAQEAATPDQSVAVLPYFPVLSFLADRRAPHRSSWVVWPVPDHPDRDRQIVAAMEADRTPAVLYSVTQWPQFPRFEEYARRSSTTSSSTSRPRASSAPTRGATSCSASSAARASRPAPRSRYGTRASCWWAATARASPRTRRRSRWRAGRSAT
jgi:hypothetical protein